MLLPDPNIPYTELGLDEMLTDLPIYLKVGDEPELCIGLLVEGDNTHTPDDIKRALVKTLRTAADRLDQLSMAQTGFRPCDLDVCESGNDPQMLCLGCL